MVRRERFAFSILITVSTFVAVGNAQQVPALSISPARATMLEGETRTFRAVGKDGRIRHNVRWSLSPESSAKLTTSGDEALVQAENVSSAATLTANAEGDSAEAEIDIRSGHALPNGTLLWSVSPLPGCKNKKMTQAVPTATGPDLYVEEECPQGDFVRALTSDGRELWRRQITGAGGVLASEHSTKSDITIGQHLDLHRASVCDGVSAGMNKDEVSKVVNAHSLQVEMKRWQDKDWEFEEQGSRCLISFDGKSGTVVKKKKTIIID
jgi:outer membrane protein assembly factor BamB